MSQLVFDATTLIHLGRAELLGHLKDLDHRMLLPSSIHDEVVIKGKHKGRLDALKVEELVISGTLTVIDVGYGEVHERLSGNGSLSRGDLDVMELAFLKNGIAVMDESYGRAVCEVEKIKHRGTIWLLREMVLAGSISKEEARTSLDRLIEEGWYCSTILYLKALKIFQ